MANQEKRIVKLPEGYDPKDMNLKKQLHDLADEKNVLTERRGKAVLCCGAKKRDIRGGGYCMQTAGAGTDHPGYGRCKNHGGASTGPKSAEGKAKIAQNARKHGFYSEVLNKEERETYSELIEQKLLGLEHEIYMMKAKILAYLKRWRLKEQGAGYEGTKQYYKEGETTAFYHAGTIEDRPLQRSLETLRRLVDSHAKLTHSTGEDLLSTINAELRAASQGQVSLSWGGEAQKKQNKNE